VEKISNYTRNEWRRWRNTLKTSVVTFAISSVLLEEVIKTIKGIETIKSEIKHYENHTRNVWRRCKTTLETSGEDEKPHSKRVEKMLKSTRNE
jgi:hypothetical protein